MIYALKLLIQVLVAGGFCALLLRKQFATLLSSDDYRKAWWMLLGGTTLAFLAHWPLLFIIGIAAIGAMGASALERGVPGRLAVFGLLIIAMPPVSFSLEGFGDINRLLLLNTPRVLALVLLLGPALRLKTQRREEKGNFFLMTDLAIVTYQVLLLVLQFNSTTATGLIRLVVEALLDVALPYYVLTRGLKSARDIRFVMTFFLIAFSFACAGALAEVVFRHNIYSELEYLYDMKMVLTHTVMRYGLARVTAMMMVPIVLAFVITYGMALWLWLKANSGRSIGYFGPLAAMWLAIVFTWSRGPLLGAMILVACVWLMRHVSGKAFRWWLITGSVAGILIKASGGDQYVLLLLSAVFGSSHDDIATIQYRQQLLDTAIALVKQSPLFGVRDYQNAMQGLVQGEHIIDIVNTYVAVALNSGLVGLFLYLFPFLYVLNRLLGKLGNRKDPATPPSRFATVYVALIVSCLITIFTTSTFGVMPLLLLFLVGVPMVWLKLPATEQALCDQVEARVPAPEPTSWTPATY